MGEHSSCIRRLGVASLALCVGACAAAPAAKAPSASPEAPPAGAATSAAPNLSEVDALERDLARDEQTVLARVSNKQSQPIALSESAESGAGGEAHATKPSAAAPAPPAEAAPRASAGRDEEREAADKKKSDESETDCALACRAVASMRRSADRICEILSDGHERCVAARRRVSDAERRIADAQCRCG